MQAEASNPGLVHDFVDRILEQEQVVGGADTTEKFLRIAAREIDRE